jgi:hypothetical protein
MSSARDRWERPSRSARARSYRDPADERRYGDYGPARSRRGTAAGERPPRGVDPGYDPGYDRRGGGGGGGGGGAPGGGPGGAGGFQFNVATVSVLAGVLVLGVGIGTSLSSNRPGDSGNIASSQQLDLSVPDPEFCKQWGASAFVMDVELYTTLNPSTSFVTQPKLQPGCVIRRENWSVLQKEGAITSQQMRECKQRMNTFAYIGSVRDKPVVRCVYQTDIRENRFLTPGLSDATDGVTPEGDRF